LEKSEVLNELVDPCLINLILFNLIDTRLVKFDFVENCMDDNHITTYEEFNDA